MHLALFMTNTDDSAFAQRHPEDDEKFTQLIHLVRPDWQVTSYPVKDGVFPGDLACYDGIMVSGSPASVHDPDAWIGQMLDQIRQAYAEQIPLFGACFGHQAIALALGGKVGPNPDGWVFGLSYASIISRPDWMEGLPQTYKQYGAHIEQVIAAPKGSEVLSITDACPIAGFRIADKVYTTQNHPEMTPDFMAALVEEYQSELPPDKALAAKESLAETADMLAYAESIARFFEVAAAGR